jgi:hypothetical protein
VVRGRDAFGRLAILVVAGSMAPAFALDPHRSPDQYASRVWGKREGLPSSWVYAVLPSRPGYLWLATGDGLLRFDGVRFTAYGWLNSPGLPADVVLALHEGRDGFVWIATDGGGLDRLRGDRASLATVDEGFAKENVYALFEDHAGSIWFSTAAHGLCRIVGGRADCLTKPFGDELVRCLLEDKQGQLWAGTSAGLVRIDGNTVHPVATEDGKRTTVTSLTEGPSGTPLDEIEIAEQTVDVIGARLSVGRQGTPRFRRTPHWSAAEKLAGQPVQAPRTSIPKVRAARARPTSWVAMTSARRVRSRQTRAVARCNASRVPRGVGMGSDARESTMG